MKTLKWLVALLMLALAGIGTASAHDRGGRVHFDFYVGGPYWAPWSFPPPAYYYPPYYPQTIVIERQPPVYIEQTPPVVAAPAPAQQNYWYYCAAAKGYYPYVKECPGGWQRVLPQPSQP